MTVARKKLIEVALPLEAINKASAREKSIRHGHPSTLHLWWARRPLAAARAVIFAQMVDDPSSLPDLFPTEAKQQKERERLFRIIEDLVQWENTTNEEVLERARAEIWQSWRRACADNADHPRAKELFDRHKLPAFHDPFAGGGALPLEAQRLGLESYASDLNPVAVLINKAMIEIPPRFAGRPPVNPESRTKTAHGGSWKGAQGLAEDVRYYGQWMRDEAEKRIGKLYPPIEVTADMAKGRPDLKPYVGQKLTVIAWLWARTVKSPNPAFAGVDVPLASTFTLSTKPGKEAHIEPAIDAGGYRFVVKVGKPKDAARASLGTSAGKRGGFLCLMSGAPLTYDYIRSEGNAGRMGARLMAIVAEGQRERVYLTPTSEHEAVAQRAKPVWKPDAQLQGKSRVNVSNYGMDEYGDLFTSRQLVALGALSDLVGQATRQVCNDAIEAGMPAGGGALREEGNGATAYSEAISVYLACVIDRMVNYSSALCTWHHGVKYETVTSVFARQAIAMSWDHAEANIFSESSGSWSNGLDWTSRAVDLLPASTEGHASQMDAASDDSSNFFPIVSTDPPYYDNISYGDLSDFFYVWLRRSQRAVFPELFATVAVPKVEELVASPYRHESKGKADKFFLEGMTHAMRRLAQKAHPASPLTIYYAFKQSEDEGSGGTASTGWETFLDAVIRAGLGISGTWPVRTEYTGNLKKNFSALASSIVLVCRTRSAEAPSATRREFVGALKSALPAALRHLQEGNIAPVDLAQAAIGPGMSVYTRYAKVLDAEGKPVPVREALALINQVLDETLAEQEGDFDGDSRFAIAWFEQHGFAEGEFGVADVLARAKNTSVDGLRDASILESKRGKVRLLTAAELPEDWDPAADARFTHWEAVHHLIRALESGGESAAAALVAKLGSRAETARELAYRLYTVAERKKRAAEALQYNALVQSWPEITRLAHGSDLPRAGGQSGLFSDEVV